MAFRFIVLLCAVGAAVALKQCQAPGTSVTSVTTSTTTTTVTAIDEEGTGIVSTSDRGLIRKTWRDAKKDGDVAPKILFRFLKSHPEYQKMFKSFASVPQEKLMDNGNFLAQAYTILAGLNVVIQSAGSMELLSQEVTALGGAHFERGATPVMFDEFSAVVVEVLGEELGSAFTAEARTAWSNGLRALSAGISRQLKKKEDLAHPITKLTPRQISDVRKSWETARNDRNEIVSTVFIKLFRETPRLQKSFTKFGDVPVSELQTNAEFNKQVVLVADRLDNMIATADDTLQLVGQINYMGYSHVPRQVDGKRFEEFSRVFLDVLGARGVSTDDLDNWKSTLKVLVGSIDKVQKNQ